MLSFSFFSEHRHEMNIAQEFFIVKCTYMYMYGTDNVESTSNQRLLNFIHFLFNLQLKSQFRLD